MSRSYSIKCPNCASPLLAMGGGRVRTITCSYCGSVIDLDDNYKILSQFKNAKRPNSPFKIGIKGKIKGVEYTIIGIVEYETTSYPLEEWIDFLLFSPLYGYAWLTFEGGHIIFSRRTRDFPNLIWGEIPLRSSIHSQQKEYKYHSTYDAKIKFVEGELTWVAKKGDRYSFRELINPPYGMTIERSKDEIEYYSDEYMDREEIYRAFEIPKERQKEPSDFHVLAPFEKPFLKLLSRVSMWVLVIVALIFVGLAMDGKGKNILSIKATNSNPVTANFKVNSNRYLLSIELIKLSANKKDLNNFHINITKDGKRVFTLSQYSGIIFNKSGLVDKKLSSWENNAKRVIAYIKLKETGTYQLKVTPVAINKTSSIKVNIKEAVARDNYFIYLSIVLLLSFLLYYIFRFLHNREIREDSDHGINRTISFDWDTMVTIFWIVVIFLIIFGADD